MLTRLGVFLLVKLIMSILEDVYTESDVLRTIATLPSSLEDVYAKIPGRVVGELIFTKLREDTFTYMR